MRTRLERISDFEQFYTNSIENFTALRENDNRAQIFHDLYTLNICPGSRNGGTYNRAVDVFWGNRIFETVNQVRNWTALTESGATLLFERDDNGFVSVLLYPAITDNRKQIETLIVLRNHIDPKKLLRKCELKYIWNDFMAYMEVTCLEGKPTLCQRTRVFFMRSFRNLIINDTWKPTIFIELLKSTGKFILNVGLSGVVIFIISLWLNRNSEDKVLKQLQINQKNTVVKVDSAQYESCESILDTVSYYLRKNKIKQH